MQQRSDVKPGTSSIRLLRTSMITSTSAWLQIGAHPTTIFVLLSLVFGVAIAWVVPPLRGPDEIAHFLRIHSYARGELLPPAAVDGRKGILVERELYNQLYFFRAAGEWFAREREQGVRYGPIMAAYRGV